MKQVCEFIHEKKKLRFFFRFFPLFRNTILFLFHIFLERDMIILSFKAATCVETKKNIHKEFEEGIQYINKAFSQDATNIFDKIEGIQFSLSSFSEFFDHFFKHCFLVSLFY